MLYFTAHRCKRSCRVRKVVKVRSDNFCESCLIGCLAKQWDYVAPFKLLNQIYKTWAGLFSQSNRRAKRTSKWQPRARTVGGQINTWVTKIEKFAGYSSLSLSTSLRSALPPDHTTWISWATSGEGQTGGLFGRQHASWVDSQRASWEFNSSLLLYAIARHQFWW